jgi:hypothetical protein
MIGPNLESGEYHRPYSSNVFEISSEFEKEDLGGF